MKHLFKYALVFCGLVGGAVQAQETSEASSDVPAFAPIKGDLSGAILFGRGNFLNGVNVPSSPYQSSYYNDWVINGQAPYVNNVSTNDNEVNNIVGIEMRYFLMDNIALKASGGAIMRNTPERPNEPAVIQDGSDPAVWVPEYQAVQADKSVDANINIGGEYHFKSKYSRVHPYAGVTIPFYYSRRSVFNPTVEFDESAGEAYFSDIDYRTAETFGFGGQLVGGVDYYLLEGLYFGFEVKPVSYIYAYSGKHPAPGLPVQQADNHTFSFFSQTFAKIGFRF